MNKSIGKTSNYDECPNILSAFVCSSKNPYCITNTIKNSLKRECELKKEQAKINLNKKK